MKEFRVLEDIANLLIALLIVVFICEESSTFIVLASLGCSEESSQILRITSSSRNCRDFISSFKFLGFLLRAAIYNCALVVSSYIITVPL